MVRYNSCFGNGAGNRQERSDTNYHEKPVKTLLTTGWWCGNIVKVGGRNAGRK